MHSLDAPQSKGHQYCGSITHSCCNDADEKKAFSLWESNYKEPIEAHYEYMINSIDFLLGWSQEIYLLAIKHLDQKINNRILTETSNKIPEDNSVSHQNKSTKSDDEIQNTNNIENKNDTVAEVSIFFQGF